MMVGRKKMQRQQVQVDGMRRQKLEHQLAVGLGGDGMQPQGVAANGTLRPAVLVAAANGTLRPAVVVAANGTLRQAVPPLEESLKPHRRVLGGIRRRKRGRSGNLHQKPAVAALVPHRRDGMQLRKQVRPRRRIAGTKPLPQAKLQAMPRLAPDRNGRDGMRRR
jgi:hypothetical protein